MIDDAPPPTARTRRRLVHTSSNSNNSNNSGHTTTAVAADDDCVSAFDVYCAAHAHEVDAFADGGTATTRDGNNNSNNDACAGQRPQPCPQNVRRALAQRWLLADATTRAQCEAQANAMQHAAAAAATTAAAARSAVTTAAAVTAQGVESRVLPPSSSKSSSSAAVGVCAGVQPAKTTVAQKAAAAHVTATMTSYVLFRKAHRGQFTTSADVSRAWRAMTTDAKAAYDAQAAAIRTRQSSVAQALDALATTTTAASSLSSRQGTHRRVSA